MGIVGQLGSIYQNNCALCDKSTKLSVLLLYMIQIISRHGTTLNLVCVDLWMTLKCRSRSLRFVRHVYLQ